MDQQRLRILFGKYVDRQCVASEVKELIMLLQQAEAENILTEPMEVLWEQVKQDDKQYPVDWNNLYNKILNTKKESARIFSIQRYWWAAASIVLLLGIGAILFFNPGRKHQLVSEKESKIKKDIAAPGASHAIITLINGEKIILDSAQNGNLARQGNVNLVKLADGRLVYSQESTITSQEVTYNILTNPRGSKVVSITLVDGTQVWLNAESSLTYPTAMTGKERRVEITGEAYFEVVHNADKPFIVKNLAKNVEVQVLGTHFNMNTYDDGETTKVTLLEGSVRVKKENDEQKIKPGQQAEVISTIKILDNVDIEEVMAWKNGKFQFTDANIETIMKQIARWYDAEIVYEGKIPGHFVVDIPSDVPVSKLLRILELTNRVHFTIVGKKIFVTS